LDNSTASNENLIASSGFWALFVNASSLRLVIIGLPEVSLILFKSESKVDWPIAGKIKIKPTKNKITRNDSTLASALQLINLKIFLANDIAYFYIARFSNKRNSSKFLPLASAFPKSGLTAMDDQKIFTTNIFYFQALYLMLGVNISRF